MAYQKQNFQPEQILLADQLNYMENGIAIAMAKAEAAQSQTGTSIGNVFLATIGTTWTENSETGAKFQTVVVNGVTESQSLSIDVVYTGDDSSESYDTFVKAQNQFLKYITNGYAKSVKNGIRFCIFGDANTVQIPIIATLI